MRYLKVVNGIFRLIQALCLCYKIVLIGNMQFVIVLQFKTFDTVQPFLVNTLGTHASVRLIQGIL